MIKKLRLILLVFLFASVAQAQDGINIIDPNYKFSFTLPQGWSQRKVEETNKQDAISYSFDKSDGKVAIMLIAFKVNEVKNLSDLVYTLEKDLTLNIPKRDGEYEDFDRGNYDGRSGKYQDAEFTEIIYYYRTKMTEGENFSYLLRFITQTSNFNPALESELKSLASNFKPDF
jgi:hypothetical protein